MKNKLHLHGLGKVYGFTLKQMLKTKANVILMVVLILFSLASGPLMAILGGGFGGSGPADDNVIQTVIKRPVTLENRTAQVLTGIEKRAEEAGFKLKLSDISLLVTNPDENEKIYETEEIRLVLAEKDGVLTVFPEKNQPNFDEALEACAEVSGLVYRTRLAVLGVTDEMLEELGREADYSYTDNADPEDEEFSDSAYMVQVVCSIIVMMVSILSANFIIRSVLEEKTSKLVETMTISVDPLSMIFGKILASVTYTFIQLLTIILGAFISMKITSIFTELPTMTDALDGIFAQIGNLGFTSVAALVISILLGCLTFGLLSGLSGVGCTSMEDAGAANSTSMLVVMVCYLVSIVVGIVNVPMWINFIPFLTIFITPAQFLMGNVGFLTVLESWIVQILVIVLLSVLCASVYRELLLYKGERYKFGKILKMAIENLKKGGKSNETN